MPKHRPPHEVWADLRWKVWERDGGCCQGPYCQGKPPLSLRKSHIDHIRSGKLSDNSLANLRVLCRPCHTLRSDQRHRGLIAAALRDGLIPADWRRFVWDNNHWPGEETIEELHLWEQGRNV